MSEREIRYVHYVVIDITCNIDFLLNLEKKMPVKCILHEERKATLHEFTTDLQQGLSMSGADQKEAQDQLISGMKSKYPQCSENVFIASDTAGAVATATEKGTVL